MDRVIKLTTLSSLIVLILPLILAGCGAGEIGEDLAYTNPAWRDSVNTGVTLPVDPPVTIKVGLNSGMSKPGDAVAAWIEEQTGISLEYVSLLTSPGDVELGQMMRAGNLPDIVPEGRFDMGFAETRQIFVNYLEYQELTPNFNSLVESDKAFRSSMLAKTTGDNELFTLGSYNPGEFIIDGVLAYRRDLFEKHGLKHDTWPEFFESLYALKELYPESTPFGGTFEDLLYQVPSWFGSGLDPDNLMYFDSETGLWTMGLFEEGFREAIQTLADLMQADIIPMDFIMATDKEVRLGFTNDLIFAAPYPAYTGPAFPYFGEGYGELGPDGEWTGSGKWVEAMELPRTAAGETVTFSAEFHSVAGRGWHVYNQSEHVAEAIALLDFLFTPEAAAVSALGPEGEAWTGDGGSVALREDFRKAYDDGWLSTLNDALSAAGISYGIPLSGLGFDYLGILGEPATVRLKYHINHDLANNTPGRDIRLQPGVRVSDADEFLSERAGMFVAVQSAVESEMAALIMGQKPMSEYDEIIEKLKNTGAEKLVDLYNTWCKAADPKLLPGG